MRALYIGTVKVMDSVRLCFFEANIAPYFSGVVANVWLIISMVSRKFCFTCFWMVWVHDCSLRWRNFGSSVLLK